MSLDASYLEYPKRGRGMDHDCYPYSNLFDRKPVQWPAGNKLLIGPVISLEYFPMIPSDYPFRAPGHMQTDVVAAFLLDLGQQINRVGLKRRHVRVGVERMNASGGVPA